MNTLLGERLYWLMGQTGKTYQQLASAMGVDGERLQELLSDPDARPTDAQLRAAADLFEVSWLGLLGLLPGDESEARATTASELPAGADAPREILLLPAGEIPTRPHDGRSAWRNPDPAGVVRATRELALDLPIDYEHQTERSRENGQAAPAAGWIKRVFERAGAVWGEVEWTERAAEMIKAREYRFISPAFQYEKATRVVRRLLGAGLTNDPAMFMRAIANRNPREETSMDLAKLRKALGLAETATEAEIVAAATAAAAAQTALGTVATAIGAGGDAEPTAVATAVSAMATSRKAIAKAAGLAEDASSDDVEQAVKTAKASASANAPDPAAFVPRAEFDRVSERLTALEAGTAGANAEAKVGQAIKDGKVAPASREWALGYAASDPEGFDKYLEGAPQILADGRVAPATGAGGEGDTLTEQEKAVCRATGVSEKDFLESRKALRADTEED